MATLVALLSGAAAVAEPIGNTEGEGPPSAVAHALPDAPAAPLEVKSDAFTFRPGLVILLDHTFVSQDDPSVAQVGQQPSAWELRAARLTFAGTIGAGYKVSYQISGEYKGFDGDPDTTWQLTDLSLTFPIGDRTKLAVGKTKETFAYEMVAVAATLPQAERVLSPFFVSRNTGARLTHAWGPNKRGTLSFGIYNDAWDIGTKDSRGVDTSARVTALVWDGGADRNRYLHVGAAVRQVASEGALRYRGRPGSNITDNFVDTGSIDAKGAMHYGGEALLALGSVSLQGEYVMADVQSASLGNPRFDGWYVTASWIPTGDFRPYDRNVGYTRGIVPKGRWGAPELVVRYADVDLVDKAVAGGRFRRVDLGANWWATTRWKAGVHWGRVWLDQDGSRGRTDTLLTRLQWIY